jgi:hypothetical protein
VSDESTSRAASCEMRPSGAEARLIFGSLRHD